MRELLDRIYFNNTIQDYVIAAVIIVIGMLFIHLIKGSVLHRISSWASRTSSKIDDVVIDSINRFGVPAFYLFVIYVALHTLNMPPRGENILHIAFTVAITYYIIRFISSMIHLLLRTYVSRQENGEEKAKQLGGIMLIVNMVIWTVGLLFLFDNMGYDITAVIAGLGIGGIAVALAAQNILGDLFNYFVIFFDRPFEIGDFIVVDQKSGTVEYIGIKTTRVRALSGEQLVFSNSDLTDSRLHNFKRMQTRRIVFKFGVIYQTPLEQLEQIPSIIRKIIEEQPDVVFDRAHFMSYGDSSLDFEVVYIMQSAVYNTYMDTQQRINLAIFKKFQDMKIEFAYPTRTLFMVRPEAENEDEKPTRPILDQ